MYVYKMSVTLIHIQQDCRFSPYILHTINMTYPGVSINLRQGKFNI